MITYKEYETLTKLIYKKNTSYFLKTLQNMNFTLISQYGNLADTGYVIVALKQGDEVIFLHRAVDKHTLLQNLHRLLAELRGVAIDKRNSEYIGYLMKSCLGETWEQFEIARNFTTDVMAQFDGEILELSSTNDFRIFKRFKIQNA